MILTATIKVRAYRMLTRTIDNPVDARRLYGGASARNLPTNRHLTYSSDMKKSLPHFIGNLAVAALFLAAQAAQAQNAGTAEPQVESTTDLGVARALDAVMARALSLRGTRYRAGGASPETGFDCSGFVGYLYRDILGFQLPRSANEIWRFGKRVEREELRPGDLVFYNTLKRPFSHVGIYLGDNQFVHAPASGGSVRVVNMDDRYWAARWNGAKRVSP